MNLLEEGGEWVLGLLRGLQGMVCVRGGGGGEGCCTAFIQQRHI